MEIPRYLFLLSLAALWTTSLGSVASPMVELPLGKVEGSVKTTVNGKEIYSFEGVPYARPPVGKHRFKEPVPVKPWVGIWQAKTVFKCMQFDHSHNVSGDEDCLYVNIYTPDLNPSEPLDVIVYIHGGAFMYTFTGGPELLLDRKVIYVTLSYRLGPLGFLSAEDELLPGNFGLKDQTLALKFIKENIEYFGGNPESITIFGVSAGGASIHFHYLMPQSRGLFTRGIAQSGTALCPWVLTEKPAEKAKKLASIVGCDFATTRETLECLKRRPATQIVGSVKHFLHWINNPFTTFGPVVDTWAHSPALPDHPVNLMKQKKVADVPLIASHTEAEGLYPTLAFYTDDRIKEINSRWDELMPFIMDYNYTVEPSVRDTVGQKIKQEYFDNQPLTKANFNKLIEAVGDRIFIAYIDKAVRLHNAAVKSPVYYYVFGYRGEKSIAEAWSGIDEDFGASHAEDTCYILWTGEIDPLATETEKQMTKLLLDLVVSFATTGKPDIGTNWPPLAKKPNQPFTYMKINSPKDYKVEKTDKVFGNLEFWESLPIMENDKITPAKDEL